MAIHIPRISQAKQLLQRSSLTEKHIPKGYFAVYVGEGEMKRFVVPVSLLSQPSFQELLSRAEEEYGFDHPRVASPFLVQKMPSLISPLTGVDYEFEW